MAPHHPSEVPVTAGMRRPAATASDATSRRSHTPSPAGLSFLEIKKGLGQAATVPSFRPGSGWPAKTSFQAAATLCVTARSRAGELVCGSSSLSSKPCVRFPSFPSPSGDMIEPVCANLTHFISYSISYFSRTIFHGSGWAVTAESVHVNINTTN